MNLRTVLLLLVALSAAGFTAYVANGWIAAQRADLAAQAPEEKTPETPIAHVLVAKGPLATGTFVKPDQLVWKPWPEEGIVDGYLVQGKASKKDLEGAVVRTPLFPGEPITKARVVTPGDRGFLAAVLEAGKRAVSVPVDATTGVVGLVFPGDVVDVLLTFKTTVTGQGDGEEAQSQTRYFSETLLVAVRVLALGQAVTNDGGSAQVAKTATLEVTPKQAERVAIGLEIGSLTLSLHSLGRAEGDLNGMLRQIRAGDTAKAAEPSYTQDTDVLYMTGKPGGCPRRAAPARRSMSCAAIRSSGFASEEQRR